jgi:hypothetical protein
MNPIAVINNTGTSHEEYSGTKPDSSVFASQKSSIVSLLGKAEPARAYPPSGVAINE